MANSVHPWFPLAHPPAEPVLRRMWRTFVARIMDVKRSVQMEGRFECAELFPLNSNPLGAIESAFMSLILRLVFSDVSVCPISARKRHPQNVMNKVKGDRLPANAAWKKTGCFYSECLHLPSRPNLLLRTNHHVFQIFISAYRLKTNRAFDLLIGR